MNCNLKKSVMRILYFFFTFFKVFLNVRLFEDFIAAKK